MNGTVYLCPMSIAPAAEAWAYRGRGTSVSVHATP